MVLEVEELTMNECIFYGRKKIIQFTQQLVWKCGNGGEKAKTRLEKLHWYEFAILREKLMATAFIHLALL